tara:strand:+ start:1448 stop:2176 length:729 start_codon:yes stop_codon:yes gene_type:complete
MKKEFKKFFIASIFISIVLSLFVVPVSAQGTFTEDSSLFIKDMSNAISSNIKEFTQETEQFVKFLFFLLVLIIVSAVTGFIPLFKDKKAIGFLFSLIVSILAVFFIPTTLILSMLNPYSALGVALLSVIPFLIMFQFTQKSLKNPFLKKVAWLFFVIILLVLTVSTAHKSAETGSTDDIIYSWTYAGISILAVFMLLWGNRIDKAIRAGKKVAKMERAMEKMEKRLDLDKLKEKEHDAITSD